MRKLIVAGNWKMNKTPSEAVKLIEELNKYYNICSYSYNNNSQDKL